MENKWCQIFIRDEGKSFLKIEFKREKYVGNASCFRVTCWSNFFFVEIFFSICSDDVTSENDGWDSLSLTLSVFAFSMLSPTQILKWRRRVLEWNLLEWREIECLPDLQHLKLREHSRCGLKGILYQCWVVRHEKSIFLEIIFNLLFLWTNFDVSVKFLTFVWKYFIPSHLLVIIFLPPKHKNSENLIKRCNLSNMFVRCVTHCLTFAECFGICLLFQGSSCGVVWLTKFFWRSLLG